MSTISNEELDEIWAQAWNEDNELVLRLVTEIGHARNYAGRQSRKLLKYQRLLKEKNNKRLRRGQEYMRDRIVLSLMDAGYSDAAVVANNHDISKTAAWEDIKEEHHANASKMQKRRSVLGDAWRRMFGETA